MDSDDGNDFDNEHGRGNYSSRRNPCSSSPSQEWAHGSVPPCTKEQLREAGFVPSPNCEPHRKDPIPERTRQEKRLETNYTRNIQIRCLEPPRLPAPGKLIIKEVRPPTPPPPEPKIIYDPPPQVPRSLSPIILRERPPSPPLMMNGHQTCHVTLPARAPPPQQIIHETYEPLPPKPRDIIVERWLPYQYSVTRDVEIVRAPPCKPVQTVRDIIVTISHQAPHIDHRIEQEPRKREDPDHYRRQYGGNLLSKEDLKRRVFQELSTHDVGDDTLRRLEDIFRVPCGQIDPPPRPPSPTEDCEGRLRRIEAENRALRSRNYESLGSTQSVRNSFNRNTFQ